ncbi:MAG TPA: hypothetical protein VMM18_15915 [Gemmatimonadaceae bacterium]|nr:hypothetical protein [Gemmatimonadaceae bacterium]
MKLPDRPRFRLLTLVAAAVTVACGDGDVFAPTPTAVAGFYEATSFTMTSGDVTIDLIAAGASLTLEMLPQGTVSGRLLIPSSAQHPDAVDADMAGTWRLEGSIVRFDQAADTFVRDMAFQATRGRLAGAQVFGSVQVEVILHK